MEIDVLLFASLKDEVGPMYRVALPDGADVKALRAALQGAHPAFARLASRSLVAVNEAYAGDADVLAPGDVVAVLPPVAGG